jgi:signal transduction histidine kinase
MRSKFLSHARKSFVFRLTLWYSAIFILSSLILFIVSYIFLSSSVRDNREAIRSKLQSYLSLAQDGGFQAIEKAAGDGGRISRQQAFFVHVVGPENKTVFLSNPELWQRFDLQPLEDRPIEGEWQYFPAKRGRDVLEVTFANLPNGYLLEVGKDIEDREEILEQFRETTLSVMIPMILIGLVGGAYLAFRALRPVRNLIHTMQSVVDTGMIAARVPTGRSGNELDELVKLFNRMLERIESLIKGIREALDNVAHDLRTPMTRLRGIAEMALRSDPIQHDQREALADCLEESERVLTLLNTLMDISEAETGTMRLDLVTLDVSQLIDEIVDLYRHVAEDKRVALSFGCPENIYITADRNRMRQVLANLLDNAIKYTGPEGSVAIDAYEKNGQIAIRVRDDGAGIPPEEISKIWDRLHRGDASRSQPGLGLGLSLVKAVVQAHKGRIGVQSEIGCGSIFTLYIPSTPAPSVHFSSAF